MCVCVGGGHHQKCVECGVGASEGKERGVVPEREGVQKKRHTYICLNTLSLTHTHFENTYACSSTVEVK